MSAFYVMKIISQIADLALLHCTALHEAEPDPEETFDSGCLKNMPEMRKVSERRQKPTPLFNRYLFRGKRIGHRRSEDLKHNVYVDRFKAIEWSTISLLFFLCASDAFLTLIHLSNGFKENGYALYSTTHAS